MSGATYVCGPDPKCLDPHPHRWHCMRGHEGAPPDVCLLKCCGGPGLPAQPVVRELPSTP